MDGKQKMITHSIHNVPYCVTTGYLIEPPSVDSNNKVYTRHFLLAYRTIPRKKFRKDHINPVDPASIVCTCSACNPATHPIPENTKTIVASPLPLPPMPVRRSSERIRKPLPKKPYLYWSTQKSNCVFRLKWIQRANDPGARIEYYELFYYREIPGKSYGNNTPWTFKRDLKKPRTYLGNFYHGGLYHYAVRSVDVYGRRSAFSNTVSLFLTVN